MQELEELLQWHGNLKHLQHTCIVASSPYIYGFDLYAHAIAVYSLLKGSGSLTLPVLGVEPLAAGLPPCVPALAAPSAPDAVAAAAALGMVLLPLLLSSVSSKAVVDWEEGSSCGTRNTLIALWYFPERQGNIQLRLETM